MTGFDETVPPDPDPSTDGNAAQDDGAVRPEGGPEATDADDEKAPPMAGDDDIASGHLGE